MGGVMNGMALHGGVIPFGGTFLVFSDYMRPAVRLAAISRAHVIYSWSHDSIGLGEDGPTHQPVEHLAALRAIPDLCLIRPADANETAAAWRIAVDHDGPVALILTRQDLPGARGHRRMGPWTRAPTCSRPRRARPTSSWSAPAAKCRSASTPPTLLAGEGHGMPASCPCRRGTSSPPRTRPTARRCCPRRRHRCRWRPASRSAGTRWVDAAHGLDRFGASAPGAVAMDKLGFNPDGGGRRARRLLA